MGKDPKKTYHSGMKFAPFILSFIFLSWGCENNEQVSVTAPQETDAGKSEQLSKMQVRGDLVYLQNTESPFTGKAQAEYDDGQVRAIARFQDGELKGLKRWWPNGATELELEFKKGEVVASDIQLYESSSSFVLVPPPAILNLKDVERESQIKALVAKHTQGLNSQKLRANVVTNLAQNPNFSMALLTPFAVKGIRKELGSSFSYSIEVSGSADSPRFVITAQASSARAAMIVADLVQHEYDKLHGTGSGQKVEFVKQTLEDLLENSLRKERAIASDMATFKKEKGVPYIEDEKIDLATRKGLYSSEITKISLEQIKIKSFLRQIIEHTSTVTWSASPLTSKGVRDNIAGIKKFLAVDALRNSGNIPALSKTLLELEQTRNEYEGAELGYLEKHPKMLENAKSLQEIGSALMGEVASAIENLKNKYKQLAHKEAEFVSALENLQKESAGLNEIGETLKTYEQQLAVVRKSTQTIHARLNDLKIEQHLPSADNEPLRKENFAAMPSSPLPPPPQPRVEDAILSKNLATGKMPWHRHGSFVAFYKNGQKQVEGSYREGKESGLWISYDQDGKETNRKSFKGGDSNASQ